MSLYFVSGDMFSSGASVLVNPVNCAGTAGAGLALVFKKKFPLAFVAYKAACRRGEVAPGRLHVHRFGTTLIVNFPTKRHWRQDSRYEDVEAGLKALREFLEPLGVVKVAIPALGCGCGGLDWSLVRAMIEAELSGMEAEILVYEPRTS